MSVSVIVPSSVIRSSCGGGGSVTPEKVTVTKSPGSNVPCLFDGAPPGTSEENTGTSAERQPTNIKPIARARQATSNPPPENVRNNFMVSILGTRIRNQYFCLISTLPLSPASLPEEEASAVS